MTQLVSLGSITFAEFSGDFSNVFNVKITYGEGVFKFLETWKILDLEVVKN